MPTVTRSTPEEEPLARVRALVLAHGWNSTVYQIINPGIDHWFSADGEAVVGYVRWGGRRVVAGAPVCASGRLPEVTAEFEADARRQGEYVCYFGAEGRLEHLVHDRHDHAMALLGAQPVWDPRGWEEIITGRASLRAQLNRARNKHVLVEEWSTDRATRNPALVECLEQWLSTRGLPPLHFLVEPATLERLFDRRIFVAEQRGHVVGFLVASPVPQRNGWLIEQIVRGWDAPNGTAELMIDAAMRALARDAAEYVTLGLAPLSDRAGVATNEPVWLRLAFHWVRAHGSRFYNFRGLETFKAKFRPDSWEAVYAISNERQFSIGSLRAIAGAFSNGSPILLVLHALARALTTEIGWGAARIRRGLSHDGHAR